MRVSTGMFYDRATTAMLDRQGELMRTQDQLSSGRRILAPSDDPIAAAQALRVGQTRDVAAQHAANAQRAGDQLAQAEGAVKTVGDTLTSIRELLVYGGNASLTDSDRDAIALELRSRFSELLGAANARDGQGRYLFAGYAEESQPFVDDGTSVSYLGDAGSRALAIGPARDLPTSVNGAALFDSIAVGSGAFTTAVMPGNTGDVSIGVGRVTPPQLFTGHDYQISFTVVGNSTTYQIFDATSNTVISSGNPYTNGAAFMVGGATVTASGTPANGDRLEVGPPARQNVFAAVREAIAMLETPRASAANRGLAATGLERALANVDNASERALSVRASLGAGMREAETAAAAQQAIGVEQERQLSALQDLDYAKAISDFQRQQQALEAAQKAFHGATQLSLFDLL